MQEIDPLCVKIFHRMQNVVRGKSNMLDAGPGIEIEIFLDLRFAFSFSRLVDGKLDIAVAVGHHLRHEGGVFGGDIFVVEVLVEPESHHMCIEIDPLCSSHANQHCPPCDRYGAGPSGRATGSDLDRAISGKKRSGHMRCARQRYESCRRRCECWKEQRGHVRPKKLGARQS